MIVGGGMCHFGGMCIGYMSGICLVRGYVFSGSSLSTFHIIAQLIGYILCD